jgi:hypothetical protein
MQEKFVTQQSAALSEQNTKSRNVLYWPVAEYLITSSEKWTPLAFLMASDLPIKEEENNKNWNTDRRFTAQVSDGYIHIPSLAVTYHDTHVTTLITTTTKNTVIMNTKKAFIRI